MKHLIGSTKFRLLLGTALSGVAFVGAVPAEAAPTAVAIVEGDAENAATWNYNPKELAVPVGATITWTNRGKQDHTASSDSGAFDSGVMKPGGVFKHKFAAVGEYPYTCTMHAYMVAKIIVR
jgi:plastocyanin